jgi:hypothetical protein
MPKSKQQVKIMTRVSDLPTRKSRKIKETESSSHGREKYISDVSLVGNPYDDQSRREQLSKDNLDWKVTSKSVTKIYVPVKYMGYIAKWKVEKIKGKNKEITSNSSLSA